MAYRKPVTLGKIVRRCPNCGEDLIQTGRDKEAKTVEKQCIMCSLVFQKKGNRRWVMKDLWDPYLI